ncbi:geranylgeranyl pyrophosphate synthetase [Fusarium mundagurra]|uniref:Geranylgeranyl pyrophosphate synthetase n=1 Tax=Fusarium mundagurra TaxID=1567541 RepID=A0A8H5Z221_9HYPO|nr:geranylgeranyl pyrophosphate synthetase [Fusarium mundagurra]
MPDHGGSQNIDNALHLLSVSFDSIQPDLLSLPDKRLDRRDDKRNVVYSWTGDDKEEFELKLVDNIPDPITVQKRSFYQEPPYIPGQHRRVPFLQKHPGHPFAVVFQAMKVSNPDWRCDHVDIIAQSDLLNIIFSWIRGDHTSSFVIEASLIKNTLCITLFKDKKHSSDSDEDESPSPTPTTVGQHHILEYSFGGLNLLVTSPGHLVRSICRDSKVCFARILPTADNRPEPRWRNVIPLLWFSGTHTCVSGSVSDGVFKQDRQWYVNRKIRRWGGRSDTREHMKTMFWLLQYVRIITTCQLFSRSCLIRFEGSGSHKRLEVYAATRAQQLPTLFGEF